MTVRPEASAVNGWLDGTFATDTCWAKLHTGGPASAGRTAPTALTALVSTTTPIAA